jgi:hypothetical protein
VLEVKERRKKKIIPLKHRWNEDKEKRELDQETKKT